MRFSFLSRFFWVVGCCVLISHNTHALAQTNANMANANTPAAHDEKRTKVSNFPDRSEVEAQWQKMEPKSASPTAGGPNTNYEPPSRNNSRTAAGQGGGKINANTLPEPNLMKEAVNSVMPMDPQQTGQFADEMYKRSLAMSAVPGGPYIRRGPRMVKINIAPGGSTEKISVAMGMGVKIAVIDTTGAPVVVDSVEGFSNAFIVRVMKTEDSEKNGANVFSIEARTLTGQGGAALQVQGLRSPIMFDVDVGKSPEVDGVVQFVVPVSSRTRTPMPGDRMDDDTASILPEMQGFLSGIAPDDAVEIPVSRVSNTTAWMWRKKLYLRTAYTVFTPAYYRRQGSADGTAVYELPLTPIVSLGVNGRETQALLDFPFIPAGAANSIIKTVKK